MILPFVFQASCHHIDFTGKEDAMKLFEAYANVYRVAMFQPLGPAGDFRKPRTEGLLASSTCKKLSRDT
jgi:hypothetical protein